MPPTPFSLQERNSPGDIKAGKLDRSANQELVARERNNDQARLRSRKTITREQLEFYLSHALDVSRLSDLCIPPPKQMMNGIYICHYQGGDPLPPAWINDYTFRDGHPDIMNGKAFARYNDCLRIIRETDARFICEAAFVWDDMQSWEMDHHFFRTACMVRDIKAINPDIIVQASVNEYIDDPTISTCLIGQPDGTPDYQIPDWVWQAFGQTPPTQPRSFDRQSIRYPDANPDLQVNPNPNAHHFIGDIINNIYVPDISQLETQMYYYYMGCRYIDAGCESLDFAQVELMNESEFDNLNDHRSKDEKKHDPKYWAIVFEKLRQYADSKPGIRFLLITGDTQGMRDDAGRLAFDFHRSVLRPCEYPKYPIPSNGGLVYLSKEACYPDKVWGVSLGGISPSGWYCVHAPMLRNIDNTEREKNHPLGQLHDPPHCCYNPFGWDELTWFELQPLEIRNRWLKYAYAGVRCLDPSSHLMLPVKRGNYFASNDVTLYNDLPGFWDYDQDNVLRFYPNRNYVTATDRPAAFQQEDVIIQLMGTGANAPDGWAHHNFTDEEVYNRFTVDNAISDIAFASDDKIYYINGYNQVVGYVKDPSKPGVWMTVTVSAHAQVGPDLQQPAISNLVTSPDGSMLLYRGTDGYIYGYYIDGIYNYRYFSWKDPMLQTGVSLIGDIVFASPDRVYYVAFDHGFGRIHGFIRQNGIWLTVSPSWSAEIFNYQLVLYQMPAIGNMAYSNGILYYVGIDGLFYCLYINDDWNYEYSPCAINNNLIYNGVKVYSNLAVAGNKIFYIAQQYGNFYRAFCLVANINGWTSQSPAWSANNLWVNPLNNNESYPGVSLNDQQQAAVGSLVNINRGSPYNRGGVITVSADGKYIAFLGQDRQVHYYIDHGNDHYSYLGMMPQPVNQAATTSLKFNGNTLYYISSAPFGDYKVHCYRWEQAYCNSSYITDMFPGFPTDPPSF